MEESGSSGLAGSKEANGVHVHESHVIEIQPGARSVALHLRLEFLEMLRLNPADQSEERVLSVDARLDPQGHRGVRNGKLRTICKGLSSLTSRDSGQAGLQQLPIFGTPGDRLGR
jgi:hypothetical protein